MKKFILRAMAWLMVVVMLGSYAGNIVVAHAEDNVLHTGEITFADSGWWTQKEITMSDLIGTAAPEKVGYIKFESSTTFTLGYNNNSGDGTAAADNPYWTQFDSTAKSYSVDNIVLAPYTDPAGGVHEYFLMLALSKADGVEYTIEWTVYGEGAAPEEKPEKETSENGSVYSGSITFSDTSWWTQKEISMSDLIGDTAPETVTAIEFESDTTFTLGYNNNSGDGTAAADNPYWTQFDSTDSNYNVDNVVLSPYTDPAGGVHEYFLMLALSKADGVEYTIEWNVYAEEAAEPTATPAPTATPVPTAMPEVTPEITPDVQPEEPTATPVPTATPTPEPTPAIVYTQGDVLTVTEDMAENGVILVEKGIWEQIVIPRTLNTKVILDNIIADEVVVESGAEYTVEIRIADLEKVTVAVPQIEVVDYKKLMESGTKTEDAIRAFAAYLNAKTAAEGVSVKVVTKNDAVIDTLEVKGNAELELAKGDVAKVVVNTEDTTSQLRVDINGYTGNVSVDQTKKATKYVSGLLMDLGNSQLSELTVNGDAVIDSINGTNASVKKMQLKKISSIAVSVDVESLVVDKTNSKADVRIYSKVEELRVQGKNNDIIIPACANIKNALVEGDSIRVYGYGDLDAAKITGNNANVAVQGTIVDGANDDTIPEAMVAMNPHKSKGGNKEKTPTPTPTPVPEYAHTGSITFADSSWWTSKDQNDIPLADLLGDVAPEEVGKIVFYSTTTFTLGYNNNTGDSTEVADNPYWSQYNSTAKSYTITNMVLDPFTRPDGETCDYGIMLALSKGDSIPYTITWEVYTKDYVDSEPDEPDTEPEKGVGSVTFSDVTWWTTYPVALADLLAGVAVEEVESITFSGETGFIVGYNNVNGDSTSDLGESWYNPYWTKTDTATTITISDMALEAFTDADGGSHDYYMELILSKGDGVEYTINWKVNVKEVVDEPDEEPGEEPGEEPDTETEKVGYTGSCSFSDSSWWTQKDVPMEDILGDVAAEDVLYIVFSSTTTFNLGYSNVTGENDYWTALSGETSYKAEDMNLEKETVQFGLSKGDGVEYTITWEVYVEAGADDEEPGEELPEVTPDEETTTLATSGALSFSDSSWWTQKDVPMEDILGDVAAEDVAYIVFSSTTTFNLGYSNVTGENDYWTALSGETSYKAEDMNLEKETVQLGLSKGDGVEYTITWEVYVNEE